MIENFAVEDNSDGINQFIQTRKVEAALYNNFKILQQTFNQINKYLMQKMQLKKEQA